MTIQLYSVQADTAIRTGTSGTKTININPGYKPGLVVCISTDNASFTAVSSVSLNNYALTKETASTGTSIWSLKSPPPGYSLTLSVTLAASSNWAITAYDFYNAGQSDLTDFGGLDAQSTGDIAYTGSIPCDANTYLVDAVRHDSNTITPNTMTEAMNIVSGGDSYGSSYIAVPSATSIDAGWTRTGSPVNDAWAACCAKVKADTAGNMVITS